MAISDDNKRGQIGPSLRGLIYQYERDGRFVTSKWPKKRGKRATENQKLAQQAFRDCMLAMKLTAAEIQMFHREASKGTPMLPRDTLMAALYGNGPTITQYSGKVYKPMANKYLASTVLDAIGWQKGDILYRGDDLWEVLTRPSGKGVLLFDDGLEKPVWGDASSLGSAAWWMPQITGGFNSNTARCKGVAFTAIDTLVLEKVYFAHAEETGITLDIGIYKMDASGVITDELAYFPSGAVPDGGRHYVGVVPPVQIVFEPEQRYAIFVIKPTGVGSNTLRLIASNRVPVTIPLSSDYQCYMVSGGSIPVGTSPSLQSTIWMAIGIKVK